MDDILGRLVEAEKTQCEEAQRKAVLAISALAAIAAMSRQHTRAARLYADGLRLSQDNRTPALLDGAVEVLVRGPSHFAPPPPGRCAGGGYKGCDPIGPLLVL